MTDFFISREALVSYYRQAYSLPDGFDVKVSQDLWLAVNRYGLEAVRVSYKKGLGEYKRYAGGIPVDAEVEVENGGVDLEIEVEARGALLYDKWDGHRAETSVSTTAELGDVEFTINSDKTSEVSVEVFEADIGSGKLKGEIEVSIGRNSDGDLLNSLDVQLGPTSVAYEATLKETNGGETFVSEVSTTIELANLFAETKKITDVDTIGIDLHEAYDGRDVGTYNIFYGPQQTKANYDHMTEFHTNLGVSYSEYEGKVKELVKDYGMPLAEANARTIIDYIGNSTVSPFNPQSQKQEDIHEFVVNRASEIQQQSIQYNSSDYQETFHAINELIEPTKDIEDVEIFQTFGPYYTYNMDQGDGDYKVYNAYSTQKIVERMDALGVDMTGWQSYSGGLVGPAGKNYDDVTFEFGGMSYAMFSEEDTLLMTAIPTWDDVIDALVNGTAKEFDKVLEAYIVAQNFKSPLALDLDGDGIETTHLYETNVYFDIDGDGFAEKVGWIGPDDALLAYDRNGDGIINDVTELFGDNGGSGAFDKLRALDNYTDGKINWIDVGYKRLLIWQDVNQDGFSDPDELKTMEEMGIAQFSLNDSPIHTYQNENYISTGTTFKWEDGTSNDFVDVHFLNDNVNTWYVGAQSLVHGSTYEVHPEALLLPLSRGYGSLPSMHIAMTDNLVLRNLVKDFVATDAADFDQLVDKMEAILFEWAGVTDHDPEALAHAGGNRIDARRVEFIEAFSDTPWEQLGNDFVGDFAAVAISKTWGEIVNGLILRFLVQGPLASSVFTNASYDFKTDSLTLGDDLDTLIERGQDYIAGADEEASHEFWVFMTNILLSGAEELSVTTDQITAAVDAVAGGDLYMGDSLTFSASDELNTQIVAGNETVTTHAFVGDGADNYFKGTNSNDYLFGEAGKDTLFGQGGDDIMRGGDSRDVMYGGAGNDYMEGSAGADNLFGGDGADYLIGGDGNDGLSGGDGDDILEGGPGADYIDGGAGNDAIFQDSSSAGVVIDFTTQVYKGADLDGDQYFNIENIGGSFYNDTLGGDGADNYINGEAGRDVLKGYGGNDYLFGADGNDVIYGGDGKDILSGGDGNDTQFGDDGNDTLYGGEGNDTIFGGDGWDIIRRSPGNNVYYGGAGNDALAAGTGFEHFYGGDGFDSVFYSYNDIIAGKSASQYGVVVDLRIGRGTGGITNNEIFDGIEVIWATDIRDRIWGTDAREVFRTAAGDDFVSAGGGDDTIRASSGNDIVYGGDGDDLITGAYEGQNTFYGENGDDIITGGEQRDFIEGGAGNDTIDGYRGSDVIDGGSGNDIINTSYWDDTIWGGEGHDVINASSGDNTVYGGAGNDTIRASSGNSMLYGEDGDDSFILSNSDSYIDGGTGVNWVDFSTSYFNYFIDIDLLNRVTAQGMLYESNRWKDPVDLLSMQTFENIYGFTGTGRDDLLSGDDDGNAFYGGAGDDILYGNHGDDILYGEEDNDMLYGGTGDDNLDGGEGADVLYGDSGDDVLSGSAGDDDIFAGDEHDVLYGDAGHDDLYGEAGYDLLMGGDGDDALYGGAGNDILYGDGGDDVLYGNRDKDQLAGGDGQDVLYGGNDADTFVFQNDSAYNNVDRVADFNDADLDKLDLSDLIDNSLYDPAQYAINNFIMMTQDGANTLIKVDKDGTATAHDMKTIALLENYNANDNVQTMVDDGRIII